MDADAVLERGPLRVDEPERIHARDERVLAEMRGSRRVGRLAREAERVRAHREERVHEDVAVERVKHHRRVDVLERAGANELDLPAATLHGGPAGEDHHAPPERSGRPDERTYRRGRDEVVAARMSDVRERVVLREHRHAWPLPFPCNRSKRGRHPCEASLHFESGMLEVGGQRARGLVLLEAQLGLGVDGASEPGEVVSRRVDRRVDGRSGGS